MAQTKRKSSNGGNGSKTRKTGETRGGRAAARADAIALLKADHREVEDYFAASLACPEPPPIVNALDTDWRDFIVPLTDHGIVVEQFCPQHRALNASSVSWTSLSEKGPLPREK